MATATGDSTMHSVATSSVQLAMPASSTKAALQRPPPLSLPAATHTDSGDFLEVDDPSLAPARPHSGDLHEDDPSSHAPAPEDSSRRKKRRSADRDGGGTSTDEEDTSKTLYECRFCFMRFAKSQALGGHMNRHRQEREKEQYQHAQQLVSSMAQQQMPRTWNSIAAASDLSPSGAGATLARLSNQLNTGAPPRADHARPQFPVPQISFNSTSRPPPTSSTSSIHSSPSSNYYLPSNSSSTNLQNLQWNVDGFSNANPRISHGSQQQQGAFVNAEDTTGLQGGAGAHVRDEFLAGVLHSRHQDGAYIGPQFGNMAPLFSRGMDSGGSFHGGSHDVQGGSGTAGLPYGHDHAKSSLDSHSYLQQPHGHRMTEVPLQLACSAPLPSVIQSNMPLETSKPATSFAGVQSMIYMNDSCKRPAFMMQSPAASTLVPPLEQMCDFSAGNFEWSYSGTSTVEPLQAPDVSGH